jgi:hypothetical protein
MLGDKIKFEWELITLAPNDLSVGISQQIGVRLTEEGGYGNMISSPGWQGFHGFY